MKRARAHKTRAAFEAGALSELREAGANAGFLAQIGARLRALRSRPGDSLRMIEQKREIEKFLLQAARCFLRGEPVRNVTVGLRPVRPVSVAG